MVYSLDEDTWSTYGAGLLRFMQFCDAHNIPEVQRMPASAQLVSAFLAFHAAAVSPSTVNNWISGLRFWHIHMVSLRAGLDISNPCDAAVWAVAAIAFWSCCRLGELTGANISIVSRPLDPTCPYAALHNHLKVNTSVPKSAPLFAYTSHDNTASTLTKSWFLARCNDIWHKAGLPKMFGHGFHIGGTTHLLLLGTHPDIVATQGRWKSRAFLEYWCRIEIILPIFITNSNYDTSRNSMLTLMNSYRKKYSL
ncbi:hypothetical protein FA15DRAFT_680564 [Coprinopsis marcescibilis]|uniref:Core-binding (CB) domain-containing protein n=1 Tax=Coprinopsis marcescibilis TaxID=230819 RepID=A0A5C3KX40_COPMA|nr:hypothetical protein FA15DRAFT_680564 [Coprinopsis marcescibilis]